MAASVHTVDKMTRVSIRTCRKYLLQETLPVSGCSIHFTNHGTSWKWRSPRTTLSYRRWQHSQSSKRFGYQVPSKTSRLSKESLKDWVLTVGIEIHAQLNTPHKLFSSAATQIHHVANSNVALFDLAMPGSQPRFQSGVLIPAIRAALALNCEIQTTSRFDRKHYHHWDQPAGFQLTQYYEPFAKNGHITLYEHDGIAREDGPSVDVAIKQVQMEQDTAKTLTQHNGEHLLDFNRVGLPLIEIITLPVFHHPATAAAFVRKVQLLLKSVDASVLGMEMGGLRADVNVSVQRREDAARPGSLLGQRTEIKNLSSFKSVEDAIIAERDRQIRALQLGEKIRGETRGWSIGSTETRSLRLKEGEVDYRYMPDPELAPVIIDVGLVEHLRKTTGILPDGEVSMLTTDYGLTKKDAISLMTMEDGGRAEYFRKVVALLRDGSTSQLEIGKLACSWVLHELGGVVTNAGVDADLRMDEDGNCIISAENMSQLIHLHGEKKITTKSAKKVLAILFEHPDSCQTTIETVEANGLWYKPLTLQEYDALAGKVSEKHIIQQIINGKENKKKFLVGQMMREDNDGRIDPLEAKAAVDRLIETRKSAVISD